MSTRKIRDGTSKLAPTAATRTKKAAETTKREPLKAKSTLKTKPKVHEDEDEKNKKHLKPPLSQNPTRKVNKPASVRKISSTAKPTSNKPATPPSNRVTKSQFFPSKRMYSNALQRDGTKKVTKTDSPRRDVKTVTNNYGDVSPDTSSMSERPRTATLRKGSIVNNNIVGPDAPKAKVQAILKVEEPPVEYEEDFDSYESDFDEYESSDLSTNTSTTSTTESESEDIKSAPKRVSSAGTDDEKKLDSGNYELPEPRHRQILDNIKESIEKENANLNQDHNRSNLGSLSDEGFEDGKSLQFLNFLGAQKKYQHRKSVELRRKRGEEILSMIRLDLYSFTLYDLPPVPYDIFIKSFGKSNTVQMSVQTGEDDLNEEVQTNEIKYSNKWTQFPPHFDKLEENLHIYKCNYLGVGGDPIDEQESVNKSNESSLEKFLLTAGNLILNIQAEANVHVNIENDKTNLPFSKSCILCDTRSQEILKNRPLNDVCFCSNNFTKILTVHGQRNNSGKSVICLWNMANFEIPEMLFFAFGEVTCCAFSLECPNLIFGGLNDGSMLIWDTKENSTDHKNVNETDETTRSPTYSTEIDYGHSNKVISIQPMINNTTEKELFEAQQATEVCSLDKDGDIVIWSVIFKERSRGRMVENQGLAHWGSVILTINVKISLRKLYPDIDDFHCTDLALSRFDSNNLYISTNYGLIIHCLSNGGKTSIKKFLPDTNSQANCLEMCPFSSEYFLAGFDNGDINFYSRTFEKPLMVLSNKDAVEEKSKIQMIQWSHNRPLVFYTKDIANTIHIWNLKISDMFPTFSVPFKDAVTCLKLSPVITTNDDALEKTYMMIGTSNGLIYVHLLNEDHDQLTAEEFEKDKRKFLNYINRYI